MWRVNKKVVASILEEEWTPHLLAIRFMDDGSKNSELSKAVILHTQPFTAEVEDKCDILCGKSG